MNQFREVCQNEETVEQLVVRAQGGCRDAQGELFVRFHRTVLSLAMRRLGHWDEAQELAQDVFIIAFERLDQLRVPAAFAGWLRQIVYRMAINRQTRRKDPLLVESDTLEQTLGGEDCPLDSIVRSEDQRQVRAGLARLGDMDRETLEAFYLQGSSLIEMSSAFDAPVGTIKRRLHTARKRLAKQCEAIQAV